MPAEMADEEIVVHGDDPPLLRPLGDHGRTEAGEALVVCRQFRVMGTMLAS